MLRLLSKINLSNTTSHTAQRCLSTQKNLPPKHQLNTKPTQPNVSHENGTPNELPTISNRYGKKVTFFELAENYTANKTGIESSRSFGSSPTSSIDK